MPPALTLQRKNRRATDAKHVATRKIIVTPTIIHLPIRAAVRPSHTQELTGGQRPITEQAESKRMRRQHFYTSEASIQAREPPRNRETRHRAHRHQPTIPPMTKAIKNQSRRKEHTRSVPKTNRNDNQGRGTENKKSRPAHHCGSLQYLHNPKTYHEQSTRVYPRMRVTH